MNKTEKQRSLHDEKFKKTGQRRNVWDIAQTSEKSVAISTELPRDIVEIMERIGPVLEANGVISKNTSYTILQYCVVIKVISLEMEVSGRNRPNEELIKFLEKKKTIKATTKRKKLFEYYPGKNTIPISSTIPRKIAELAKEYSDMLEKEGKISTSTPYNMWKYCAAATLTKLDEILGK